MGQAQGEEERERLKCMRQFNGCIDLVGKNECKVDQTGQKRNAKECLKPWRLVGARNERTTPTSFAQSRQRLLQEMSRRGAYDSRQKRTRAAITRMTRNEVSTMPSPAQRDKSKSLSREVHCHPSLSRHCTSAIVSGDDESFRVVTRSYTVHITINITSWSCRVPIRVGRENKRSMPSSTRS